MDVFLIEAKFYITLQQRQDGSQNSLQVCPWGLGLFPLQLSFRKLQHLCAQDRIPLERKLGWRCMPRLSEYENHCTSCGLRTAEIYDVNFITRFLPCIVFFIRILFCVPPFLSFSALPQTTSCTLVFFYRTLRNVISFPFCFM